MRPSLHWPLRLAGALLVASAAATGWSTYLHWLPCRGTMLEGSVFRGYVADYYSPECLRRMDSGLPFPFPPEPAEQAVGATELGVLAMALCAVAGLVLAVGLRIPKITRLMLAAIVTPTLIMALLSARAAGDPTRDPEGYVSGWLWVAGDVLAIGLMLLLSALPRLRPQAGAWRLVVLIWSVTAFGMGHAMLEYVGMGFFSSATWDLPPGTGTLTVVVLVAGAAVALVPPRRLRRLTPAATNQSVTIGST